jgi:hypothetical protein
MTAFTYLLASGDEMIQVRHRIHARSELTKHPCDAIVFTLLGIVSRNGARPDMT